MKTSVKETYNSRLVYLAFTGVGLFFLALGADYSLAGVFLSLALIFNPFPKQTYYEFSIAKKALVIGQMLLALALIGMTLAGFIGN